MTRLAHLNETLDEILGDIGELVRCESPSADLDATLACADVVDALAERHLGKRAERHTVQGRTHLRWAFGARPSVLLVGHFDTVWPLGTIDEIPFDVADDRITGPGSFDMKVGVAMALHAMASLDDLDGVTLLLTSDEELGSPTSRALIEQTAVGHDLALVLEGGLDGGVKTARKGVSLYDVRVHGKASHAGLDPYTGVSALMELGRQLPRIQGIEDRDAGTSVTPTVASAGTTTNTVPALASVRVDVRGRTPEELERVDAAMHGLAPTVDGARLEVLGGINRPPMTRARSAKPFALARQLARELGIGELAGHDVGGGSDGNFTAAAGVDTLDGLGAVGAGAHARHEHAIASVIPARTALVAGLVEATIAAKI